VHPDIQPFVRGALGGFTVVEDKTWSDGRRPTVLHVRDRAGREWYVKRNVLAVVYHREIRAYSRWAAALGERAPRLVASDDDLLALLVTALPGASPANWQDVNVQREAGRILRRLHHAESLPPIDDIVDAKLEELDRAAPSALGLVGAKVVDLARSRLKELVAITPLGRVPCHLDYSPRNWLVDDGRLSVIDFGDSGPDAWVNDLGRLFLGWDISDEAKEAFLDGYGRTPNADEYELLEACYAARMIESIVFAREYGLTEAEAGCRRVLANLLDQ
jgi:Ser/Thr protein kinase RdoA (MazF antagonist)